MKVLTPLVVMLVCAGCADIPELEGSEAQAVRNAPYPKLIPLQQALGAPADPEAEAAAVEEELTARSEALAKKAQDLQNASAN